LKTRTVRGTVSGNVKGEISVEIAEHKTEEHPSPICQPPKRVRRRNRSAKQIALLSAAKKLFAERGYDATTTREIAATAGCAEGLIHRYFNGKAGLLLALLQQRDSQNATGAEDFSPLASRLEDEFLRLVDHEVERVWQEQDFLKVAIPQAILNPTVGKALSRDGGSRLSIVERLRKFKQCEHLREEELEIFERLIDVLGFAFGFLRPVLLGQDRLHSRKMAAMIAKTLIRSLQPSPA
jgi:TetR/AcrR family transcriptional regulator, regulator of cefoperazone and chloramphenicol sensitivity